MSGLGFTEYCTFARLLGLEPNLALTPIEREHEIPAWLRPPLISTNAARERLTSWARRTPREDWSRPLNPDDIFLQQPHFGDELLAHVVAHVIAALPRPIVDAVLSTAVMLSTGAAVGGLCMSPLPFDGRCRLLVFSWPGDVELFRSLVAHECCHHFLLPAPAPGSRCEPSLRAEVMHATPLEQVPAAAVAAVLDYRRQDDQDERQCRALVRFLGHRDPSDFA